MKNEGLDRRHKESRLTTRPKKNERRKTQSNSFSLSTRGHVHSSRSSTSALFVLPVPRLFFERKRWTEKRKQKRKNSFLQSKTDSKMTTIASMPDLPSSDEEDEDYDPQRDPTARDDEALEAAAAARRAQAGRAPGRKGFGKRKQGGLEGEDDEAEEGEDDDDDEAANAAAAHAGGKGVGRRAEAKARVEEAWAALSSAGGPRAGGGAKVPSSTAAAVASLLAPIPRAADAAVKASEERAAAATVAANGGASAVSLASLCAPAAKRAKVTTATTTAATAATIPSASSSKEAWLAKMGLGGSRPSNIAAPASETTRSQAKTGAGGGALNSGASAAALAAASDPAALAAARAALQGAASAAAAAKDHGMVRVTETKRFAGRDVEMTRAVTESEAAAAAQKAKAKEKEREKGKAATATATATAAAAAEEDEEKPSSSKPTGPLLPNAAAVGRSGLDATLAALDASQRRVNVVGKTRADWGALKASDAAVDDELERYKKGGDAHVEKRAFLARAERAAYERERDARLNSDVRTRGRL